MSFYFSVYCCINCVLVFHLFAMILLVAHVCNILGNFQKNIFYMHVHQKVPCFLKNTPHTIFLSSISPNEGNAPTSVLWYWKLAEIQDHSSLESCSWSQSQVILLHYSIECYTIQKTKPLVWHSTMDPSSHFYYSHAYVYSLQLEYFVIEIHHGGEFQ